MQNQSLFKNYVRSLTDISLRGDAREESYYASLAEIVSKKAAAGGRPEISVTTLPRSTDAGNPDFRVWNGNDRIIGYIEAKKPTEERLDQIETSEQIRRYRATFPNLILTNFLEFRLYRNGERVDSALLARPFVLSQLKMAPPIEQSDELGALFDRFLDFSLPKVFSAESLAIELAKRTRFLRDVVARQLADEQESPGALTGFYEAFQQFLIGHLTPLDFADLYAQTITYGLFAARVRAGTAFSRRVAFSLIPRTIGVLRDLFRFISMGDLPSELEWTVDDISEVLAVADAPGILAAYFHEGKGSDPIVHFYETFLAQYDPEERERRGVYYTPEPVVSYIVRSLHNLLKTEFDKPDGLASAGVTLLDPAAGTMTFVANAAREAVAEFEHKYGGGGREEFIRVHILRNFYAFELMMAPYAVGHLKMSFFLEELGHRLADNERVCFYLTNTLDMDELAQSRLPGFSALAEEARLAGQVKKQAPILIILGNPPYSYHSLNRGDWILKQVDAYRQVDGQPLGEQNPRGLQDDYVKFLRFAQWKIEQAGRGVVGMVTNHGYLDNPTFRGMRQSLMRTFDDIYLLDLHGNALKRERAPDGSSDENVFDIRQGVAVAFFVKRGGENKPDVHIRHAELWGTRVAKYSWLETHNVGNTGWQNLHPKSSPYLFIPLDETSAATFQSFQKITDIFPAYCTGLFTARDSLTVHLSPESIWRTVTVFAQMEPELARQGYQLGEDSRDWRVTLAQKDLLDSGPDRNKVAPILYRPFDVRYTYYTGRSRGFICMPRPEVMRHMLHENLALVTTRMTKGETFQHAQVSTTLVEKIFLSPRTSNNAFMFPLYLYPEVNRNDLFAQFEPVERQPNLNPKIVTALTTAFGRTPAPESIVHYIYAVLYAPTYRTRYAEFLRLDFPRIPFTVDRDLFASLASLGERLVALHLLNSPELDTPTTRFEGTGEGRVSKRSKGFHYDPSAQRVYINPSQYFAPVSPAAWAYQIGGYQVCDKWLKDRQERQLNLDEIRTYCRIVTALELTIAIQAQIDALYPSIEAETITWPNESPFAPS